MFLLLGVIRSPVPRDLLLIVNMRSPVFREALLILNARSPVLQELLLMLNQISLVTVKSRMFLKLSTIFAHQTVDESHCAHGAHI